MEMKDNYVSSGNVFRVFKVRKKKCVLHVGRWEEAFKDVAPPLSDNGFQAEHLVSPVTVVDRRTTEHFGF